MTRHFFSSTGHRSQLAHSGLDCIRKFSLGSHPPTLESEWDIALKKQDNFMHHWIQTKRDSKQA